MNLSSRPWAPFAATLALAVIAAFVACGRAEAAPANGTLLGSTSVSQHSAADVDILLADMPTSAAGAGRALCGVSIEHIDYSTLDPAGHAATASAAVMMPTGNGADCIGPRPVLLYSHGTTTLKSYDMADVEKTPEALAIEGYFAAAGYIVIAPNYLGYDSSLDYHPYLNAEVQAGDMIDGLRAGLQQVARAGIAEASKTLFLAGYSQGGHVAMATQKVLERDHADEFAVTASVPMSGPYDLVMFGDAVTSPDGAVNIGGTLFMPYLLRSYQNSYGGIYQDASEVYQSPYDQTAPTLFPTDTPVATLLADGDLPNDPTFRLLFGPGGLITDAFRAAYPTSNFRAALQRNSLLGWNPKAPMALCGGMDDPTVYFSNATSAAQDFASRGIDVPVWDLEVRSTLPAGMRYDEIYDAFQFAKLQAGDNVQMEYHGELLPPACYALARGYFAAKLPAATGIAGSR